MSTLFPIHKPLGKSIAKDFLKKAAVNSSAEYVEEFALLTPIEAVELFGSSLSVTNQLQTSQAGK